MRNFLPIILLIFIQTAFDCFATRTTHWAVFCNCGFYASIIWMIYRLAYPFSKIKRIPFYAAGFGFVVLFVLMALKWNLSYNEYKNSMGKMESVIPFCFVIFGGFIYYILKHENIKRIR